jgi:vacuolar-type H+-ATPase subunit I/STV1
MSENGEKKTQKILEGIQYLIGDNKHLREELKEFAQKADEDRRRSDQRFERMMEKMEEDRARSDDERARSDERFATILDQVKRTNRVAVDIARDIRGELRDIRGQLRAGQQQTNQLLGEILNRLPPSNGK